MTANRFSFICAKVVLLAGFVCFLTRAVGAEGMERVLAEQRELRAFRTYQKQRAHQARPLDEQLHGFMWNRKQKYAVLLVEALNLERVPRPLDCVLASI